MFNIWLRWIQVQKNPPLFCDAAFIFFKRDHNYIKQVLISHSPLTIVTKPCQFYFLNLSLSNSPSLLELYSCQIILGFHHVSNWTILYNITAFFALLWTWYMFILENFENVKEEKEWNKSNKMLPLRSNHSFKERM